MTQEQQSTEKKYDVLISYARPDADTAILLRNFLTGLGLKVFIGRDIPAGNEWEAVALLGLRYSRIILVLVSQHLPLSEFFLLELNAAIGMARQGDVRLIPVFLPGADFKRLPYGLTSWQGLEIKRNVPAELEELAERILQAVRTGGRGADYSVLSEPPARSQLRDTTEAFFRSAQRKIRTVDGELWVPEAVRISSTSPPTPLDVRELANRLNIGEAGFFAFTGRLPPETSIALDSLRVKGNPIVPLSANAMSAAIADNRAADLLYELEDTYRSQDNLFDTRNALVDERFFFGREELLTRVGSALSRGEHVLLTGLRKAGKTSFLNILRQRLSDRPVCFVDFQRYDRHSEDWPKKLFSLIVKSYDDWGSTQFPDWPGSAGGTLRITDASELELALSTRGAWQRERGRNERLVLVLDEFERVLPAPGETQEANKFEVATGALRFLGQSAGERLISIIGADLRPDVNRRNTLGTGMGTNPFFKFFLEIPLPLLDERHTYELVESIARAMGITVSTDFLDRIYQLSGGHPALTRVIAGASYRNKRERDSLDVGDLERGYRELLDRDELGSFFRNNLWELMGPDEKSEIIKALHQAPWNRLIDRLRQSIGRRQAPSPARSTLFSQGLLDERRRMRIGSFIEWLKTSHFEPAVAAEYRRI